MKNYHKDPNVKHVYNNTINIKSKKDYPYKIIEEKIKWFEENYSHVMEREGFDFHIIEPTYYLYNDWKTYIGFFTTCRKFNNDGWSNMPGGSSLWFPYYSADQNIIRKARKYGWQIDKKGIIYDFSEKIFNDIKFTIPATDLGLL